MMMMMMHSYVGCLTFWVILSVLFPCVWQIIRDVRNPCWICGGMWYECRVRL